MTTTPWVTLDEVEGVEVLGALADIAQVHTTCGNPIVAAHYQGLYIAIQDRARNPVHPLVTAFHALCDVKDNTNSGVSDFTDCYDAIQALKVVMINEGIRIPVRFDVPRDPDGEPG